MRTRKIILLSVLLIGLQYVNSSTNLKKRDASRVLSRRRRYVTFPEGSSFSVAGCVTVGVIGQPAPITTPGVFTWGMNWGLAYELPNETQSLHLIKKLTKYGRKKPQMQRRNRRDLYQKLEVMMEKMGYDGRSCILKTLCETTQRILPKGDNVIHEIFRTIFTLPMSPLRLSEEPPDALAYDAAHRLGRLMGDCDARFASCPLSLVDLALGYYDAPRSDMMSTLDAFSLLKNFAVG